jgi:predicted GNAT superfamily acetyltransferase
VRELRHPAGDDYDRVIVQLDDWWSGREMTVRLPRLWFDHFADTSFVVEEDGAITAFLVGFVSSAYPDEAYVHFVGVDPKHRGQGLGRELYERFFALVAGRGRRTVGCVTSPVNDGSIAFHLAMGFQFVEGDAFVDGLPVHTGFHGPCQDRVVFRRTIASRDAQGPGHREP